MYLNLVLKVLWFVLFHSVQTPYYDQSMSEIQIALFCSNTVSSLNKKKQVTRSFQVVPTDVHIISIKPFQTANFLSRKTFIICLKISPVLTIRISVALFMIIKYCLFLVSLFVLYESRSSKLVISWFWLLWKSWSPGLLFTEFILWYIHKKCHLFPISFLSSR